MNDMLYIKTSKRINLCIKTTKKDYIHKGKLINMHRSE